jgi:hypothetical protein
LSRARIPLGLLVASALVAGCGGGGDYANEPRPPAPINVTAAITDGKVTVSPTRFGAGPIVLIIANESGRSHRLTVETNALGESSPGLKQSTGPINPQGTATLKLDMKRGDYTVSVAAQDVRAARVRVGAQRKSSQDQLLLP